MASSTLDRLALKALKAGNVAQAQAILGKSRPRRAKKRTKKKAARKARKKTRRKVRR